MCVIVTFLEAHLVEMLVGVGVVTVHMVVHHMLVLVLVVGMVVDVFTVRVRVIMRCRVFVFLAHYLDIPFLPFSGPCPTSNDFAMPSSVIGDVVYVAQRLVEQRGDVRVEKPIDDLTSTSISDNQSEIPQYPQLVRDRWLLHFYFFAQVTYRTIAGA